MYTGSYEAELWTCNNTSGKWGKKNEQMNLQYHVSALDAHFDSICLSSDAQMAEIFKNQNTLKEWNHKKKAKY